MDFKAVNEMAQRACGIAPREKTWPTAEIVSNAPLPQCALAPSQQVYMDICDAIAKLAALTKDDCRRGSFVAADHGRHLMFELVQKLGPAMFDVVQEHGGPTEECRSCGDIVALCRCDDDDISFAED